MGVTRRNVLKVLAGGSAAAVLAGGRAEATEEEVGAGPDAAGLLYDAARCIGCRACMVACNQANGLPPDRSLFGGLYQAPASLNAQTKNIIKLYRSEDGQERSFVKQQCMHCVDPACVSGCPMRSLHKAEQGIVAWDPDLCIGCRYCQIACPFNIPRFEWEKVNPKIVKCELCRHLLAKGEAQPACSRVCPTRAVIFGKRAELLGEAKRRIAEHPGVYYEKRVYGEHEGGGTQVLYLSRVPFEKLGLPALGKKSLAGGMRHLENLIYRGFLTPILAYGGLVAILKGRWEEHLREHHAGKSPGKEKQG